MHIDIESSSEDEPKEGENTDIEGTVEGVKDTVKVLTEDERIAQRNAFLQIPLLDILNIKKFSKLELLRQSMMQAHIHTVGDVLGKTVEEALQIDGLGVNSIYVIADRAQQLGLSFSGIPLPSSQGEVKISDILQPFSPEKFKKSKILRYLQSEVTLKPNITVSEIYGRKLGIIAEEMRSRRIYHHYAQWSDIMRDLVEIYMRTGVCILDAQNRLVEKKN